MGLLIQKSEKMLLSLPPANITTDSWQSFLLTVLPYLTIFGLVWKAIDKVFEYFGKRGKEATKEVVKDYVTPKFEEMKTELEGIKNEHKVITRLLREIKGSQ